MKRILIVDSEPCISRWLAGALMARSDRTDFVITTCDDDGAALKLMSETRFDVVLTDIGMPGCSGSRVAEAVRKSKPSPVLLMMTTESHMNKHIIDEFMPMTCFDKPFLKFNEVVAEIKRHLRPESESIPV